MIRPFDILRKRQRFTLLRDACDQNIDTKIAMFCFDVAVLQIWFSKSGNCYCTACNIHNCLM